MPKGFKVGGRKKGVPNKFTICVKEMILKALDGSGGINYLMQQAQSNPTAFMTLVGKVLPLTLAGDKDNPIATSMTQADSDLIQRYLAQKAK